MRISTSQIFQQGLNGILQQQARLSQTQLQLSTGKRINSPSDDPVGAARLQELERNIALQDVYDRNTSRTRQRLQVAETAVQSASDVIQRVRELTVQAANDTLNANNRAQIAVELRQRLDQLVGIANTRDGDGEFIFAGAQARTTPFVREGGEVIFQGDSIQRELTIAPGVTMRDGETGDRVFMALRDGNGVVKADQVPGNSGSGFVAVENAITVADYPSERFTVQFINGGAEFNVLDGNGDPIAGLTGQTYVDGGPITLPGGAEITLTGAASEDDLFAVTVRSDTDAIVQAGQSEANTGAARLSVIGPTSPAGYDRAEYSIEFLDNQTFVVTDEQNFRLLPLDGTTGPDPLDNTVRAFEAGDTVSFAGVNLTLRGSPEAGDEFVVKRAANQSVFATLEALINTLEAGSGNAAQAAVQRQGIDNALSQLDRIETRFLEVRADFGGRQNTLDSIEENLADQKLSLEALTSEVRDLDYAEAITRLQQELVTLQAAQQSFVRIQGLSLFQFLR